jgi:hypothetical protein
MKEVLRWLVAMPVRLTTAQLAEAVSIAPGDTKLDFDGIATNSDDVIAPISQLLSVLRGSAADGKPEVQSYVQLCHFTVKEYLTGSSILEGPAETFFINEEESHALLARKCLQYLSFSNFVSLPLNERLFKRYSLLGYVANHWATHLRLSNLVSRSLPDFERRILPYLGWFLDADIGEETSLFRFWHRVLEQQPHDCLCCNLSPLAYSIFKGLDPLVSILLPRLRDINEHITDGETCLIIAVEMNNVKLAKQLLDAGASVDFATKTRRLTPLHIAAENAWVEMVGLLL